MQRFRLALVLGLVIANCLPGMALAYSPTNAAAYADAHWNSCGNQSPAYPCFSTEDCTNFVSQAFANGGFAFANPYLNASDDHNWWIRYYARTPPAWAYTRSWSTAQDQYNFLMVHSPGGTLATTYPGTSTVQATAANRGDVYFYDWQYYNPNIPHLIDHASLNVGYGSTADGHYGDYVDAHTTNHYHAFWTLQQYNLDNAKYTLVYAVQVSSSN